MKRFILYSLPCLLLLSCAGPQIKEEEEVVIEDKTVDIELSDPPENTKWTLKADETYIFSWSEAEGQSNYKLLFSLSADMSKPYAVSVRGTSQRVSGASLDGYMQELGVESEATADIWWSVAPYKEVAHINYNTFVSKLTITRM